MRNFCPNCGSSLLAEVKFCPSCGTRLSEIQANESNQAEKPKQDSPKMSPVFPFKVRNKEKAIANKSVVSFMVFAILAVSPLLIESEFDLWFVSLIGILGSLTSAIVFFLFRSRGKKMNSLITGEQVLASWYLDEKQKADYVDYLFQTERSKNKVMFIVTSLFIVVIFGLFALFVEEGSGAMVAVGLGLIALISVFAFGMPNYYRNKNKAGDGVVLIGKKFAYVNGFFHNWDFVLSGISKCKIIEEPFHGIFIQYYYTDRTLTNSEELHIPAPKSEDLNLLVENLKSKTQRMILACL